MIKDTRAAIVAVFCCLILAVNSLAQMPAGWSQGDIGAAGIPGTTNYASSTYTVTGAGNLTSTVQQDVLHFTIVD